MDVPDKPVLILAALLGISIVLLIRGLQIAAYPAYTRSSPYAARRMGARLIRWAGLGMLAFPALLAVHLWNQASAGRSDEPPQTEPASAADLHEPARLLIPQLGMQAEIIDAPIVGWHWDISGLREEVAHLEGTSYPGEPGNAVLAGHVTIPGAGWGPFQELESLVPGDRVFVEVGSRRLMYEVTEARIVDPTLVEVTYPTPDTRLTLLTCVGWNELEDTYTHRLAVTAMLMSDDSR